MEISRETRIVITGASSGIGRALCKELVPLGAEVLGIARSRVELEKLSGENKKEAGNFSFLVADLNETQDRTRIINWVRKHWNKLDVLVNNAGTIYPQKVSQSKLSEVREIMEVNFFASVDLMVQLLPLIRDKGIIVNILSPAIFKTHPNSAFYAASKAALQAVSRALRKEMSSKTEGRVFILDYYPGIVKTNIFKNLKKDRKASLLIKILSVNPEFSARQVVRQIRKSKGGEYFDPIAWMLRLSGYLGF